MISIKIFPEQYIQGYGAIQRLAFGPPLAEMRVVQPLATQQPGSPR